MSKNQRYDLPPNETVMSVGCPLRYKKTVRNQDLREAKDKERKCSGGCYEIEKWIVSRDNWRLHNFLMNFSILHLYRASATKSS